MDNFQQVIHKSYPRVYLRTHFQLTNVKLHTLSLYFTRKNIDIITEMRSYESLYNRSLCSSEQTIKGYKVFASKARRFNSSSSDSQFVQCDECMWAFVKQFEPILMLGQEMGLKMWLNFSSHITLLGKWEREREMAKQSQPINHHKRGEYQINSF